MKKIMSFLLFLSMTFGLKPAQAAPEAATTLNFELVIHTKAQSFYDLQDDVEKALAEKLRQSPKIKKDGILYLFIMHTSAALTIAESSDDHAKNDLLNFLDHLAPRDGTPGVQYLHNLEGPDDPPSHLKSALLQQSLTLPVENGKPAMGRWQRIYLMEFRDNPKPRTIKIKYKAD